MNHKRIRSPEEVAMRVSAVSIAGNISLALLKALAGIVSGSGALLSDAVHSAADLSGSLIVILGIKISARKADRKHPYGHERFECVAAIILAWVLLTTGLFIGLDAVEKLQGNTRLSVPGGAALAVAAISITSKEALFRYTWFHAQRHDLSSLRADAWHHRSDALSSLGVFIGIAGARMGFPKLDSIASLIVCAFIARAAYTIFRDAIQKMVDHACSAETENALRRHILEQPDVLAVDTLRTREFGSRIYAEMEIRVDGQLSLAESCLIVRRVHDSVEAQFAKIKHISICAKPAENRKDNPPR